MGLRSSFLLSPVGALLLCLTALAGLRTGVAWDTSNIWFPDPNNPVFHNLTFYQEAAKAVQRASASTPPSKGGTAGRRPLPANPLPSRTDLPPRKGAVRPTWQQRVPDQPARWTTVRSAEGVPRTSRPLQQTPVGFRSGPEEEEEVRPTGTGNGVRVLPGATRRDWGRPGDWRSTAPEASNTVETDLVSALDPPATSTSGPSKCVWAIISCCKPSSTQIRYMCFETLGCHGAFWDTNPCSKEMKRAAVQATANFYNVPNFP